MLSPLEFVRSQFPSLASDWIFFDNAGGSQTLKPVVDRISDYLLSSNVQLGASYGVSRQASERVLQAQRAIATLMNAAHADEIVMGGSTSLLLRILALGLGQIFRPGDEVIVTNCDHEANISPWMELAQQGITVKTWSINPETLEFEIDDLIALLTDRTRLVTMTHTSNILGTINPIKAIAAVVHAHGALLCVDGVGYAPHRLVDVQDLDVDFYVFSFYKVYGPHYAVLYGKQQHLLTLPSFNHHFIPVSDIPYKLQPGNVNYELSYGMVGLCDYLSQLAQHFSLASGETLASTLREQMVQAFEWISAYEGVLGDRLLRYLTSLPQVRIIGSTHADRHRRVPTVSFVVEGVDSATIPPQIDPHRIGIRYGDFYAKRLIADLGLMPQNGVIRVSMVHYNSLAEVDRLIECLEPIL